jgi:hypothetical protein
MGGGIKPLRKRGELPHLQSKTGRPKREWQMRGGGLEHVLHTNDERRKARPRYCPRVLWGQ